MNTKKLFKNEYLVSIITMVVNLAISMLYSAMIARYLGAEIKGETAYISSVSGIVSRILMFGLHQTYAFYRGQDENIKNKYLSHVYLIFLAYTTIAVCVCVMNYKNIILIATIIMSVVSAYSGIIAYIFLIEHSVKRNILMMIMHFLQIVYVGLLFLFAKPSLFWGITNLIFVELIVSIVYTIKLKAKFSFELLDRKFLFRMFKFGFIPMITILVARLNYKMDVIMLEKFSVDFSAIGVYSIGLMLADKVLLIPETLKGILLSKLAKGKKADEVAKVMRMCLPVCFVMFGGIFILGEQVIGWMYGPQYDGAYIITWITMFGVCMHMFYNMIEVYNIVQKKQSVTLIVSSCSVVLNVALNSILIPRYSIVGAGIATTISYFCSAIACMVYFSRKTQTGYSEMLFIRKADIAGVKKLFFKSAK